MNNRNLLELQLLNDLKVNLRMRELETELIEQFDFAFNWVMKLADVQHTELPNKEGIFSCLQRIEKLMDEIYGKSPDFDHSQSSPGDLTKPKAWLRLVLTLAVGYQRMES